MNVEKDCPYVVYSGDDIYGCGLTTNEVTCDDVDCLDCVYRQNKELKNKIAKLKEECHKQYLLARSALFYYAQSNLGEEYATKLYHYPIKNTFGDTSYITYNARIADDTVKQLDEMDKRLYEQI